MTSVSATATEVAKIPPAPPKATNGKLRVMCRYGGSVVSLPQTKSLHYIGGDTRIVAVPDAAAVSFSSLVNHLAIALGVSCGFKIKYQLPDHGLDSLISVETDEDLQIMMEEHGRLSSESSTSQSRIRLFLFPLKGQVNGRGPSQVDPAQSKAAVAENDWLGIGESEPSRCGFTQPMLQHPKTETWFVDALRSSGIGQSEGSNGSGGGSGDGNGGFSGQESIVLETNSSFGSTSSSVSLTNLPPIKSSGEDNMANVQVKFAPTEAVTSENCLVTPTPHVQTGSSHELPTRPPPVLENKGYSNLYETGLLSHPGVSQVNKPFPVPVPVPVPGYQPAPLPNQAHHQHIQYIYPGQHYGVQNPPGILPYTPYYTAYHPLPHPTNHVQFQPPPPSYPVYYIPTEQRNQPHTSHWMETPVISTNQPPAKPESPVVRCNSPLIPELASPIYPTSQSADTMTQIPNEAHNDLEEDTARAQIYKSQPPAPILPSQYQPVMVTEAFAQLRTGNA
ncbi:PREDICTED: uncharacterized protein LOC104820938 [Tarenaya hassleriana]|uniref:uncharacterized protein LOC104820938 n=1 Tax=Tarenaya hassleriana TaxID=28532 RepID=UPI00053C0833|nr:PREDICTED: uncharacterized protein LOC104820938 [Tarenaya hassleriana]